MLERHVVYKSLTLPLSPVLRSLRQQKDSEDPYLFPMLFAFIALQAINPSHKLLINDDITEKLKEKSGKILKNFNNLNIHKKFHALHKAIDKKIEESNDKNSMPKLPNFIYLRLRFYFQAEYCYGIIVASWVRQSNIKKMPIEIHDKIVYDTLSTTSMVDDEIILSTFSEYKDNSANENNENFKASNLLHLKL